MKHRFKKQHFETVYDMKYQTLVNPLFLSQKATDFGRLKVSLIPKRIVTFCRKYDVV